MVEKLSAIDESQDKIQLLWRLERELERYDEGVVDLGEDGPLGESMCDFRSRDDVGFADGFEGVYAMSVFLPSWSKYHVRLVEE